MEGLTIDQKKAMDSFKVFMSMAGGGFFLLEGPAGSGKSYMLNALLAELGKTSKRVALSASTHKAAKVASDFTDGATVFTAHALLGLRESIGPAGELLFKPGDKYLDKANNYHVIIVDEASMLDDVVFDGLEDLVNSNKKIVLVGDSFQIPPVNHVSSLPFDVPTQRELSFTIASLTEVVRQAAGSPIIQTATRIREHIYRPVLPLDYMDEGEGLLWVRYALNEPRMELTEDILSMFASDYFKDNPDYCKVLAWRNKTVDAYNMQIRHKLFGPDIAKLMVGEKVTADAPFIEGDRAIVNNNEDMEIIGLNEEMDQVGKDVFLKVYKAHMKIYGIGGKTREVILPIIHEDSEADFNKYLELLKVYAKQAKGAFEHKSRWQDYYKFKDRYAYVKYSYCMTTHKAQGSTYHHAIVCLWDIMYNRKTEERNRIIYTAVTRPKYTLKIIY